MFYPKQMVLGTLLLVSGAAFAADMTPSEAKAYWDSLSAAQQQALIAYAKTQAESAKASWDSLTPEQQAAAKAAAQEKVQAAAAARRAGSAASATGGGHFGGFGR
jgi:hypothetical protein